jgi:hypothetical protein
MRSANPLSFLTIILFTAAARAATPQPPAIPLWTGTDLPTPPAQSQPWTPPKSTLPVKVQSAITALYSQGFPDPRGCEYRQVQVVTGTVWGEITLTDTHGWVLPPSPNDKNRYVICLNGLIYPAVTVGSPASLKDDVDTALQPPADNPSGRTRFYADSVISEGPVVATNAVNGIRISLLFRLGETDLAERLFAALTSDAPNRAPLPDDLYKSWANDWAWCLFDRALCAFMRSDDKLALADVQQLTRIQPLVEAECDRRGFERYRASPQDLPQPHLPFLEQLPALRTDLLRRTKAKDLPENQRPQIANQTIPKLIQNLENVHARQFSQPGGLSWEMDPTMTALLAIGQDAVPALLSCWESDDRLTRSVSFHRDFARSRTIGTVKTAARIALSAILKSNFETLDDAKTYWEKNKGLSEEDRWYNTLKDDAAAPKQWLEAAELIAMPTNVTPGMDGSSTITNPPPGKPPALHGEALRAKKNPSVLELLAQRTAQVSQGDPTSSEGMSHLQDATTMALAAAKWDPQGAQPILAAQMKRCLTWAQSAWKGYEDQFGPRIAELTVARVRAGDHDALIDFANYLRQLAPENVVAFNLAYFVEPLWHFPDEQPMPTVAQELFLKSSPWVPILQNQRYGTDWGRFFVNSPMLGVDAFRQRLLRELVNTDPLGTITLRPGSQPQPDEALNAIHFSPAIDQFDPLAPKEGAFDLRVCDLYAQCLSNVRGLPWFAWYWPAEKRDAARAAMIQRLTQFGERYKYSDLQFPGDEPPGMRRFNNAARLTFPKLDHPATKADLDQGRAIFSLEGQGNRRLVPLDSFPARAKWTALNDHPVAQQSYDPTTKTASVNPVVDQTGFVWQAEEVQQNGTWTRYYGFVGRHTIEKVPASQIQFLKETEP